MKKKIIGIIVCILCLGVSISSAISVDIKPRILKDESEECRECKGVSNIDIVNLERQFNKLKVYSKLLLILSKHKPEVLDDYEELNDMISALNILDLNESICERLINILTPIMNRFSYCLHQCDYFTEKNRIIMAKIYNLMGLVYMILSYLISDITYMFECENPYYPDYTPIILIKK